MADIIIDLGEDGEIIVESVSTAVSQTSTDSDDPTEKAGVREAVARAGEKIRMSAEKALKLPLTGLAKVLLMSLPDTTANEQFQLDEFTVEFNFGLKAEAGTNMGAVAKIMPEGVFKCTYKWTQRPTTPSTD